MSKATIEKRGHIWSNRAGDIVVCCWHIGQLPPGAEPWTPQTLLPLSEPVPMDEHHRQINDGEITFPLRILIEKAGE